MTFLSTKSKKNGFTLIELLVSISIFTMLASVVLAATSTVRIKAKNARIQEEVSQLRIQLELGWDGTTYRDLLSDTDGSTAVMAVITQTTVNPNVTILASDILKQTGTYYGGTSDADLQTCSAPVLVKKYCADSGYTGGACTGNGQQNNGLTIFTNNPADNNCHTLSNASRYAIYAAFNPVGRGGYICMDSSNGVMNVYTGGIPSAPGINVTCI